MSLLPANKEGLAIAAKKAAARKNRETIMLTLSDLRVMKSLSREAALRWVERKFARRANGRRVLS